MDTTVKAFLPLKFMSLICVHLLNLTAIMLLSAFGSMTSIYLFNLIYMPKYYYVKVNGAEYLRTVDALLASMLFQQVCQQSEDVALYFGGRLFASSSSLINPKNVK